MQWRKITGSWSGPAGHRELLALAGPLILSTGSFSIQQFVDRVFISWYSPEALAAVAPAGMLAFTIIAFFMGTAAYVNTFVAQYHGAGRPDRVGASVWQALYFSFVSGVLILAFAPLGPRLFAWFGHAESVQKMEVTYFQIMCLNGFLTVYISVLSGFFSGRGHPWPVVWLSIATTIINTLLNYAWISGHWGFPAWGIAGAAWATFFGQLFQACAFTVLFFLPKNRRVFGTWRNRALDRALFRRLMRFGLPSGMQFMMEILCFTLFLLFLGRIGTLEMAASNMAWQINLLAFLPMIGCGVATSTLVGRRIGEGRPDLAERVTWNAWRMMTGYMSIVAILYFTVPTIFIDFYESESNKHIFPEMRKMAIIILRFVAFYSVFDAMNIIFASALKGAGDTRFVMFFTFTIGILLMVLPTWLLCQPGADTLYYAWFAITVYLLVLSVGLVWRFRHGAWRDIRVIE